MVEPEFYNIEELFEGFGREKTTIGDSMSKHRTAKENKFLESLSCAFGTTPADMSLGRKLVDILTANFPEMSPRELCENLMKKVQDSLNNLDPRDSTSSSAQELLLKLHHHLSLQLKQESETDLQSDESFNLPQSAEASGESFDSISSLGILDLSDMSSFAVEENGKIGDDSYQHCIPVDILNEIEDLQHINKKLTEENAIFRNQLNASEESNHLLHQEKADLKKEIKKLQENLKEINELELRSENLRTLLTNSERKIKDLTLRLEEVSKENGQLLDDLVSSRDKLQSVQLEVDNKQQMLTTLAESHLEQKESMQKLYQQKEAAEKELNEARNKYRDLELSVEELNDANQALRQDKSTIEVELDSLKQQLERALEHHGKSLSELSLTSNASSPSRKSELGQSLCCEMSNIITCSENMPTPFCGKPGTSRKQFYSLMSSAIKSPPRKKFKKHRNYSSLYLKRLSTSGSPIFHSSRHKKSCRIAYPIEHNESLDILQYNLYSPQGDSPLAMELSFTDKKRKYEYEDAAESERNIDDSLHYGYENLFLKHVCYLLSSLVEYIKEVNVQAKQDLGLDIGILETKLIEAKHQSESKIDLKASGDSNMPPQEHNATRLELAEKLAFDLAGNDIQQQICAELKALKTQLVRSHALLSYLEKEKYASASPDLFSEKIVGNQHSKINLLHQKSFDAQQSNYFHRFGNKDSISIASHKSTPLHQSHRTQSCPTFIDDLSFASKSTQTELVVEGDSSRLSDHGNKLSGHTPKYISVWNRNKESRFSECSSTSEVSSKSAENLECGVCEVHHLQKEVLSPCLPRHRTNSFLSAVVKSNNQSAISSCDTDLSHSNTTPESSHTFDTARRRSSSRRVVKIAEHEEPKEKMIKERTLTEEDSTDAKIDKIRNDKEKSFKMSQRSMRRSSGAGSPNSLSSIPRYPAFDLDEQDEEHTLSITIPSTKKSDQTESTEKTPVTEVTPSTVSQPKESLHTIKESSRGKSDHSRATLMPEVMENSETESAKGSFEYESFDPQSATTEGPPLPVPDMAFPNLPNSLLSKLGISKDSSHPVEAYDEQELENKFMTLSLAFKTDKMTLSKRLEIQKRQRDLAEKDVENEIKAIKESLNHLNLNAATSETRDLIAKIQTHVDIVSLATSKVSARSETYGAVKQEERVSCAFEVMMHHVENLRRLFDKEHRELEETKRILTGTQASYKKVSQGEGAAPDEHKRSLKTFGLAIGTVKSVVRRRASVADFHTHSLQESFRSSSFSQACASGFKDTRSRLISALMPLSSSSSIGLNSNSSSTHLCTSVVPSSQLSSQTTGSRRCSLPASSLSGSQFSPKVSGSRVKEAFHLGRSPSEMKISVAPSLSSVVDEEHSDEEKSEESPLTEYEEAVNTLPDLPTECDWDEENTSERQQETETTGQQDPTDSSDEETAEILSDIKKDPTVLQRIGFPHVLHLWQETSTFNLFRYLFTLFLGLSAFIVLVLTFLPSENRSANEDQEHSVRQKNS